MSVLIEGGLNISPVITHRYSYKEFEKGFEAMRTGDSFQCVGARDVRNKLLEHAAGKQSQVYVQSFRPAGQQHIFPDAGL